jgi:hypothetical protein
MHIRKIGLATLIAIALATVGLTACDPPAGQTAGPNKGVPEGNQCISTQSWWQKSHIYGFTQVPQLLPTQGAGSGVGGHLHVEMCFPVNMRVNGDSMTGTVHIKTHQRFTGVGDRLDFGLAPGGETIHEVPLEWDSRCPSGMCHTSVTTTIPLDEVPDGHQIIRIRYLPANHPNGDRQFASNELPFWHNVDPSSSDPCPKAVEGKGWYDSSASGGAAIDYARAGVNGCLPGNAAKAGNYTFNQRFTSTNFNVGVVETYVDAKFGADVFATRVFQTVPPNGDGVGSSGNRNVTVDTTQFADGWHCLSVLTSTRPIPGTDGVNTGVQEFPILIDNPGGADAATARATEHKGGACWFNNP